MLKKRFSQKYFYNFVHFEAMLRIINQNKKKNSDILLIKAKGMEKQRKI